MWIVKINEKKEIELFFIKLINDFFLMKFVIVKKVMSVLKII